MDTTQRRPLPVRLASLLLALTALTAALSGRVPVLAAVVVVGAVVSVVAVSARRPGPIAASVGATVVASVLLTVVGARSRHVLDLTAPFVSILAALLLARPDARAYFARQVESHGVGQTSTDGL